jgi:transposase-like protein
VCLARRERCGEGVLPPPSDGDEHVRIAPMDRQSQWYDLHRAVDKGGQTRDFLRTPPRDERAAMPFLTQAIRRHGVPQKSTIEGSEATAAALRSDNREHGTARIRRVK